MIGVHEHYMKWSNKFSFWQIIVGKGSFSDIFIVCFTHLKNSSRLDKFDQMFLMYTNYSN